MLRKTKIICTLGPAVDDVKKMEELINAGMNVARFNFSHGDYEEQSGRIELFKQARENTGAPVAMLLDTKGPEIRIGKFATGEANLKAGDTFTLLNEDVDGDDTKVSVTYKNLANEVQVGTRILINDGLIEVIVKEIKEKDVVCEVVNGGRLTNKKSINIPNSTINLPSLTDKDISDIKFGIEKGFDYIAASFIRKAEDIVNIKKVLDENGGSHIKVIAKIENRQGIDNFDKILEVADGIMVARGDLGVEIPMEEVPIRQKEFIRKCCQAGKPVVTATQMLESMQKNPRPTRAEVSDVANAIFDGTDAIMLSGESAAGQYPLEAVETMARIARRTEQALDHQEIIARAMASSSRDVASAMGLAVADTVEDLGAQAVIACTQSGATARAISKYRPSAPVIAATSCEKTATSLALYWGVQPVVVAETANTDELLKTAATVATEVAGLEAGETAVVTAGLPAGEGNTNLMHIHEVK